MSGKKKKRSAGGFFRTLLLLIALGIFCFSGYQLFGILRVYYASGREYSGLAKQFTSANAAETKSGEKQVTGTASQVNAAALHTYESISVRLFAQTDALKGALKNSGTADDPQTAGGNTAGTPGSDQSGTVQEGSAQPGSAQPGTAPDGSAQQSG
ncbi:MAG: hypothetical protein Q4B09_01275, partial [Lachnospiraceae bacterium]|nr:hypothetical protein [Lachnospiraceae bacterium]